MIEKICIILLANLVFFSKTLCYKYSSDDIPVFNNPPTMSSKWKKILCWLDARYRSGPQVDHALTTLIHAIVCVFIYLGFGKNDVSFIAALLFAFNPTNNQGSVWISGRYYALAALGMTGALAFPYFSLIFLTIATYTNAGYIAPLLLLGSKYMSYYYLAIPLAWWINWKKFNHNVGNKMDQEMLAEDKSFKWEKFPLVVKTFAFYATLSVIPFQNTFYHSYLESCSGSGRFKAYSYKDRFFWFGIIMILSIIGYFIFVPWNMISLGLLWWCVCIAPFCNLMRMQQETSERYCYLPMIGLMVVLASLIVNHPLIIAIFITMYATRLWFYMDAYTDDYYLLEHSCICDPSSWFVWHHRGIKRWHQQSIQEAIIIWSMARLISPNEFKINFNLATACHMAGFHDEAKKWLEVAKKNIPPGQEEKSAELIAEWNKGKVSIIG